MKKEDWPAIEDLGEMADKDFKDHFICNPKSNIELPLGTPDWWTKILNKCADKPTFKNNCPGCGELIETVNDPEGCDVYHGDCFKKAGLPVGGGKK